MVQRRLWQLSALAFTLVVLVWPLLGSGPSQAAPASVAGAIDTPSADAPVGGVIHVQGWAIDQASPTDVGVDRVVLSLDGLELGPAHLGQSRPDIAAAFGPRYAQAGWSATLDLDTRSTPGPHLLEVRITSPRGGQPLVLQRSLQVAVTPRFGVNAHLLWFDPATAARDLDRARANGLRLVRFDVSWERLEPSARGVFDAAYLASLDDVLDLAGTRGLQPILTIVGTPAWARPGSASDMAPPSDTADFASAVGRLAAHLAQRPQLTYEVWNEPNQPTFWASPDGPDAATYTRLLQAAYMSIKSAAPSATVLGGSLAFNDPSYLEAMYAAGAGGAFDGLALHPYSLAAAPESSADPAHSFAAAIGQAHAIMAAHGDGAKPLWITEMGWSTPDVSDAQRADYFARTVSMVRSTPNIAAFVAYELNQADDTQGPQIGLLAADGTPTASWSAYGQAVRSVP